MDVRSALKSQYHAALKTLLEAIENCPGPMWNNPADGAAPFWRVAYHTLFFAHMYLQQNYEAFTPWANARAEAHFIDSVPWDHDRPPEPCEPYTRSDLCEYWRICDGAVDAALETLDLSSATCGFPWYQMPKLEHVIVSIRHIQHHAAALSSRLRRSAGIGVRWVPGA